MFHFIKMNSFTDKKKVFVKTRKCKQLVWKITIFIMILTTFFYQRFRDGRVRQIHFSISNEIIQSTIQSGKFTLRVKIHLNLNDLVTIVLSK